MMDSKKKISPKLIPYNDNEDYSGHSLIEKNYTCEDYGIYDIGSSKFNMDESYKTYSTDWYPSRILTKGEFQRIVNEIQALQKLSRQLTAEEGEYLSDLWGAIEPAKPAVAYCTKDEYLYSLARRHKKIKRAHCSLSKRNRKAKKSLKLG